MSFAAVQRMSASSTNSIRKLSAKRRVRSAAPTASRSSGLSRVTVAMAGVFGLARRDELHLSQVRKAAQRLELDLPDSLAREAEPLADLLERLRLLVDEAVAEDEHLPLALRQRAEREHERLAAQRDLDPVLGQRVVAGDEVAERRVVLLTDRLVERCGRTRGSAHLPRLFDRQ